MRLVSSDMHRVVINHGDEYDTFRFASTVDVFVDRNSGYVSFFLLRYQILIIIVRIWFLECSKKKHVLSRFEMVRNRLRSESICGLKL